MSTTITAMGSAGDGVALGESGTRRHIPRALPGEILSADGRLERESPERVDPPCAHFSLCGACALQHWALAPQAEWKRGRVEHALRQAGFAGAAVTLGHVSPPATRRRADLSVVRAADGSLTIGFHGPQGVLAIPECRVLRPEIMALLPRLAAALRPLQALRQRADAAINLLDSGADILLRLDGKLTPADIQRLADFARAENLPRIATREGVAAQIASVRHAFGRGVVAPPPGAFLQATVEGEDAIIAAVLEALPKKLARAAIIADLFAGLGTLSFPLSERARVLAYEGDPEATAALDAGARAAGGRVTAARRDLIRQPLLPAELAKCAVVVLDPPYAGAAEQVAQIARGPKPHLVYVSCNPVALERDARVLREAGYTLTAATAIDQFLWSPHIEAVAGFAPPRAPR
jgi:23S rRNA (uracil1939-C5)-methyltransferase